MIVVDSSVWIDFLGGRRSPQVDRLDTLIGRGKILVGDLILCEVLQGFRRESEAAAALRALSAFEFQPMGGRDIALRAAANYRSLRRAGVTIRKTIDLLIGTFCIAGGYVLLHADRDFEPMVEHLGLRTL